MICLRFYWSLAFAQEQKGEGTFSISIRKDNEYKLGWQICAEFQIQLHKRDLNLLLQLQDFFSGIGSINISKTRQSVTYSVKSIKNIITIIIPHFLKYKLLTPLAFGYEQRKKQQILFYLTKL